MEELEKPSWCVVLQYLPLSKIGLDCVFCGSNPLFTLASTLNLVWILVCYKQRELYLNFSYIVQLIADFERAKPNVQRSYSIR